MDGEEAAPDSSECSNEATIPLSRPNRRPARIAQSVAVMTLFLGLFAFDRTLGFAYLRPFPKDLAVACRELEVDAGPAMDFVISYTGAHRRYPKENEIPSHLLRSRYGNLDYTRYADGSGCSLSVGFYPLCYWTHVLDMGPMGWTYDN